jgi:hypothetical protein
VDPDDQKLFESMARMKTHNDGNFLASGSENKRKINSDLFDDEEVRDIIGVRIGIMLIT